MLQRCTLAIGFLALLLVPVSSLLVRLRRPSAAFGAAAGARLLQQQQRHRHRLAMSSSSGGGGGGGAAGAVLLLGTTEDKASVGMVNALVRRGGWESMEIPEGRAWRRIDAPQLFLWQITRGFLRADNLDRQWMQATGTQKLQGTAVGVAQGSGRGLLGFRCNVGGSAGSIISSNQTHQLSVQTFCICRAMPQPPASPASPSTRSATRANRCLQTVRTAPHGRSTAAFLGRSCPPPPASRRCSASCTMV